MKNLNKENFWNPMREKYPQAVEVFCEWIDEYKKVVGWNEVFGSHVKFHDLPYEMQMGIMNRFFIEQFASKEEYEKPEKEKEYHNEMVLAIEQLQETIIFKN